MNDQRSMLVALFWVLWKYNSNSKNQSQGRDNSFLWHPWPEIFSYIRILRLGGILRCHQKDLSLIVGAMNLKCIFFFHFSLPVCSVPEIHNVFSNRLTLTDAIRWLSLSTDMFISLNLFFNIRISGTKECIWTHQIQLHNAYHILENFIFKSIFWCQY